VPRAQTCCGQPAYNSGDRGDAKAIARQVIAAFAGYDYVVAPSGSCAGMVRAHYPELFADEPAMLGEAQALAARTWELVSFLVDVRGMSRVAARWEKSATYHDPARASASSGSGRSRGCARLGRRAASLRAAGAEVCCGFGGTFCVKYPEISDKMVTDKAVEIAATGTDAVLAGDLGCLLNIAGKLTRLGRRSRRATSPRSWPGWPRGSGDRRPCPSVIAHGTHQPSLSGEFPRRACRSELAAGAWPRAHRVSAAPPAGDRAAARIRGAA